MALGNDASLLLRIKGDATDAVRALNQTEREAAQLTTTTTGLASSFSSFAAPAALVAVGITAVATAAIAGGRALFEMSRSASEFGSAIFDASEKTGLSAERLSAMKFAADQSGTSLDAVTAATARFSKVIGDAANGSNEAEAKLKRLGVTSTDLDTALKQALETIVKTTGGAQQMALAMDAFGKSGADLLPFIKSFDGDLDALTQKAKELGVTITDEAAAAADEFGDQLDTLSAQFAGVGRTIGNAFMPIFLDMARSLSDFLTRNQSEIQRWGTAAADIIRGFIVTLQDLDRTTQNVTNSSAASWLNWSNRMLIAINPVAFGLQKLLEYMGRVGSASRGPGALAEGVVSPLLGLGGGGIRSGGGRGRAVRAPRDTSERDAERLESRDLSARLQIELGNLKTIQSLLTKDLDALVTKSQQAGLSLLEFKNATTEFTRGKVDNLVDSLAEIEKLERAQLKADATENERAALQQKQEERRQKIREDFAAKLKAVDKEYFDDKMKRLDDEYKSNEALFAIEEERRKRAKEDSGAGKIPELQPIPSDIQPDVPEDVYGIGQGASALSQLHDFFTDEQNTAAIAGLEALTGAFQGLGEAIGQAVSAWVLYGSAGQSVRQVTAQILAGIAQQAAVKAIFELAEGFAALALAFFGVPNAGPSATAHFTAAAIYGSVAGIAAIAGRAVAGDSFKKQTASGGAGGYSGANRNVGGQGSAYSSYGTDPLIRNAGANTPSSQPRLILTVKDDSRWLGLMLKAQLEENGQVRDLIRSAAEG